MKQKTKNQLIKGGLTSFFSESGSTTFMFIISLLFLYDYNSPSMFALIQLVRPVIVILLNPFLGSYVDSHNKRAIALTSQLCMTFVYILLFLSTKVILDSSLFITILFISIIIVTICTQLRHVSYQASVVSMVPNESINKMVSTQQTCSLSANLVAPFIGSLFYSVIGFKYSLAFVSITELAVFLGILSLNFNFNDNAEVKSISTQNLVQNILAGFSLLKTDKKLFHVVCLGAIINFFLAALNIGLPITVVNIKHLDSTALATINVALALGMVIGGILSGIIKNNSISTIHKNLTFIGIIMVTLGVIVISSQFWIIFTGLTLSILIMGMLIVITNILISTYIKQTTPLEFQGRISGTVNSLVALMSPLGIISYGYIFTFLSPTLIYILSGSMIGIICLIGFKKNK